MKIGDLVVIIVRNEPFYLRPSSGSVGIIVDIKYSNWLGRHYYVMINGVAWRFYKRDMEVISE